MKLLPALLPILVVTTGCNVSFLSAFSHARGGDDGAIDGSADLAPGSGAREAADSTAGLAMDGAPNAAADAHAGGAGGGSISSTDGGPIGSGTLDGATTSITSGAGVGGLPDFFGNFADSGVGSATRSDAGFTSGAVDGAIPSPPSLDSGVPTPLPLSAVPSAGSTGGPLALTSASDVVKYTVGCGEGPLCFLQASIATASQAYGAVLSTKYPVDTCARNIADDKGTVLIGDSYPRVLSASRCTASSPGISLGFFIPDVIRGASFGDLWIAYDGFRSQWRLVNGKGADSGDYEPIPGSQSTIQFARYDRFSGGEAYGQLQVPLRHTVTGGLALGFVRFDVLIR